MPSKSSFSTVPLQLASQQQPPQQLNPRSKSNQRFKSNLRSKLRFQVPNKFRFISRHLRQQSKLLNQFQEFLTPRLIHKLKLLKQLGLLKDPKPSSPSKPQQQDASTQTTDPFQEDQHQPARIETSSQQEDPEVEWIQTIDRSEEPQEDRTTGSTNLTRRQRLVNLCRQIQEEEAQISYIEHRQAELDRAKYWVNKRLAELRSQPGRIIAEDLPAAGPSPRP